MRYCLFVVFFGVAIDCLNDYTSQFTQVSRPRREKQRNKNAILLLEKRQWHKSTCLNTVQILFYYCWDSSKISVFCFSKMRACEIACTASPSSTMTRDFCVGLVHSNEQASIWPSQARCAGVAVTGGTRRAHHVIHVKRFHCMPSQSAGMVNNDTADLELPHQANGRGIVPKREVIFGNKNVFEKNFSGIKFI